MIEVKDFFFQYRQGKQNALNNIGFSLSEGGFLGLIGPAGAGKTTLLYALSGLIPHHFQGECYGSVKIGGKDTFDTPFSELCLSVGMVMQDIDSQMVATTVEDELFYGLENFGVPKEEGAARVEDALNRIGISDLRFRQTGSLSGGQKQKVAIAAILALRPRLMLLDEPTGELDPESSYRIFSILKELNQTEKMTIVIAEQKIMLLCQFVETLAVLDQGELKYFGPVREVLRHSGELKRIGVRCPRVVSLSEALIEQGVPGNVCLNTSEAEGMIRRAVQ